MPEASSGVIAQAGPSIETADPAESVLLGYIGRGLMMISLLLAVIIARWHLPLAQVGISLAVAIIYALPGWAIAVAVCGHRYARLPESWIWGTVLGWAITSYVALLFGYLVGEFRWAPIWVTGAISLFVIFWKWGKPRESFLERVPRYSITDYAILWGTVALSLFFVLKPYTTIGELTEHGHAYPWLFGFDFINRVSIAANGAVSLPPDFFHIAGEKLYYYMLTYFYPISVKALLGPQAEMLSIMIVWQVLLQLVFVACLISVLRLIVRNRYALLLSAITTFFAYSYYWIYVAARTYAMSHPESWLVETLGTGWMSYSYVSHLLYRYFLVEPQTILGFLFLLTVVGGLIVARGRLSYGGAIAVGMLMAALFGTDGLMALWAAGAIAVYKIVGGVGERENRRRWFLTWVTAGMVFVVASWLYFVLGMYATQGASSMVLKVHPVFLKAMLPYLFLEMGSLLFLGLIGGWLLRRTAGAVALTWWLAFTVALICIGFLQSQYDDQLGLLKGTRFAFLLLVLSMPLVWQQILKSSKRMGWIAAVLIILLAVPTWFTDRTRTANADDVSETVYVTPEDQAACFWIRHNLPPDAIIQSAPSYINYRLTDKAVPYSYPLMANFAERPMVIGAWGMPQNLPNILTKYYKLNDNINEMLSSSDADSLASIAASWGIEYLYVGPWEQRLYPQLRAVTDSRPDLFEVVYDADSVRIYSLTE